MRKSSLVIAFLTALGAVSAAGLAIHRPVSSHISSLASNLDEAACDRMGNLASAILDENASAANIASARAEFELGVAECMGDHPAAALAHYETVRTLLHS